MTKFLIFILLVSLNVRAAEFVPTNFTGTKEEVREVFDRMWGEFKNYDNFHCYRRAHILSYQLDKMNIKSMKAFFFKGAALKLPMDWYYHVAPMVYYNGEGVVMDKGLFKGATTLKDWLLAFGEGKTCLEVMNMQEVRNNYKTEHCMYMVVPMYYYGPLDLEVMDLEAFAAEDLMDMLESVPRRRRAKYETLYPLP